MKYVTSCIACESKTDTGEIRSTWARGEITNELYAICVCPHGHKNLVGIMHDVPDILYQSAVMAFRSGYYSESILTFTAALERAYELFLKTFCYAQNITVADVEKMWKTMKSQSERQYGAFCVTYCATTKTVWEIDMRQVEFRNNVVHKGYIATKKEAYNYACYMTEKIGSILIAIEKHYEKEATTLFFENKKQISPKIDQLLKENPGMKYSAAGEPSLLDWHHQAVLQPVTFDAVLLKASQLQASYERMLAEPPSFIQR